MDNYIYLLPAMVLLISTIIWYKGIQKKYRIAEIEHKKIKQAEKEKIEAEGWRIIYENGHTWNTQERDPDYGKYDTISEYKTITNSWNVQLHYSQALHAYFLKHHCKVYSKDEIDKYREALTKAQAMISENAKSVKIVGQ